MVVRLPTSDQFRNVAEAIGLSLSDDDMLSYLGLMAPGIENYNKVDAMADELPPVRYPRTPGYRPVGAENKYNAWYHKTSIRGAEEGKLKGKTVVLKDNILLAGVPMMNGAATLEGYVPDIDATVVTRILDAGGTILGKAHCEHLCMSGGSHTNSLGPTSNPHKLGYSAGGSSSGCAVLVAAGEADMAIGGDQGGSIRIPSAFCGIYGMKPTHGLVPYTGIMPVEVFVDHAGPMTASVADNATLLEVIAGKDGYDPRQLDVRTFPYSEALDGGIAGMRIGVLKEGFGHDNSEPDVDAKVRNAGEILRKLGATVEEVSIPEHLIGGAVATPILMGGFAETMMWGDGFGLGRRDLYVTSLMDFHRGWRQRADELSDVAKLYLLLGTYVHRYHGGRYYGKAINITRRITAAYDAVLAQCDLLLMPTLPMKATPIPASDATREEYVQRAEEMAPNTVVFDITHHPAMSVPCGISGGLPIGLMLVGKHYDEPSIYRAAFAFEQAVDWTTL